MKLKLFITALLLTFTVTSFYSCNEEVGGTVEYNKNLFLVGKNESEIVTETPVDRIHYVLESELLKTSVKYGKTWEYTYSGKMDEALIEQDKIAIANFDEAVAEFKKIQDWLNSIETGKDGGSFICEYKYQVMRAGKIIKESDLLTFKYNR
ncbi:MAG: hypothetical protein ACRCZQ_09060 [Bacteroidales bacterium]